jgi:hypothetical protein
MKSPTLQTLVWILLTFCIPLYAQSQTKPVKKEPVGSISGKVTVNGKGTPGIVVGLSGFDSYNRETPTNKGTTDQEGNYRITNVPPGSYRVMPASLAFVLSREQGGKYLLLAAGETVEGIDFALIRGGVITGKVTDSAGRPLIEEQVTLWPVEENKLDPRTHMFVMMNIQTDDRGVYRFFGIPPGKYRVAVGEGGDSSLAGGPSRSRFKQTFHPSVTDPSKAAVVEVSEGGEATNIDVTVGATLTSFAASGRIVDGETGHPVANIKYGVQILGPGESSMLSQIFISDGRGEFRLENLTPGKYAVFLVPTPGIEMIAEPAPFEVVDQDVTGVLVKVSHGASVSGVVVFEGPNDRSVLSRFGRARLSAWVDAEGQGDNWPLPLNVSHDGSFRIGGLRSGMMHFSLATADGSYLRGFMIKRVERDGISQPRGIEIKDSEPVTGIRLVIGYGNGTVRGLVKVSGGNMPATARFTVWLTNSEGDLTLDQINSMPSPTVDSLGRFIVEGLPPGNYEVNAAVFTPDSGRDWPRGKQQVSVADGEVTEVTVTVELNRNPRPNIP